MVFHTTGVCAWSRSNSRKICDCITAVERHARKTFQNMRSAGYHEKIIGRTYFGGDQVSQLNLVLYNTIKWPYHYVSHFGSDPVTQLNLKKKKKK